MFSYTIKSPTPATKIPEHEVHKLKALALEEPVPVDRRHEATRYLSMRFIS